jgi:hypothetical protein
MCTFRTCSKVAASYSRRGRKGTQHDEVRIWF